MREAAKTRWAALEKLVSAEPRISQVAADLVRHFEARTAAIAGKGMIVAMTREICVRLYNAIKSLRPDWHRLDPAKGAIKVIMTGSAADDELLRPHVYNPATKKLLEKRFKDPNDPLQLVIVRDMWLTGFDVPCLHTLYVDKPMLDRQTFFVFGRIIHEGNINREAIAVVAVSDKFRDAEIVDANHTVRLDSYFGLNLPAGEYRLLVVSDMDHSGYYDETEVVGERPLTLAVSVQPPVGQRWPEVMDADRLQDSGFCWECVDLSI